MKTLDASMSINQSINVIFYNVNQGNNLLFFFNQSINQIILIHSFFPFHPSCRGHMSKRGSAMNEKEENLILKDLELDQMYN